MDWGGVRRATGMMAALLVVVAVMPASGAEHESGPGALPPDPGSAVALARAQGSRVEVPELRTETRTVYAEPDGTHTEDVPADVTDVVLRRTPGFAGWQ